MLGQGLANVNVKDEKITCFSRSTYCNEKHVPLCFVCATATYVEIPLASLDFDNFDSFEHIIHQITNLYDQHNTSALEQIICCNRATVAKN